MAELVALGVAAEIVVVVEDEDFRLAADVLQIVVRGCEAAHAGADDDEVVGLAGVGGGGDVDGPAIAQRVRNLERSDVIAAHPRQRRRIVSGRLFRRVLLRLLHRERPLRQQQRARGGGAHAVDEVAARDRAIHSERAVVHSHQVLTHSTFHIPNS